MGVRRSIIAVLAVMTLILAAIFLAIGLRTPQLSLAGLPTAIPTGNTFVGRLIVENPRHAKVVLRSTRQDLRIAPETLQITWPAPPVGTHRVDFTLFRDRGNHLEAVDDATWQVTVEPIPEQAAETESVVAPAAEAEPVAAPPAAAEPVPEPAAEALPAAPKPEPEVIAEREPRLGSPERPELAPITVTESADRLSTDAPAAERMVETVFAPEPPPPPLPRVAKLADEVAVELGDQRLFGRGRPGARTPRLSYVRGHLAQVRYPYAFADEPALADQELAVLLRLGAELVDGDDPLAVPLTPAGQAAVIRHGHSNVRLPVDFWGLVFRSTTIVSVVNHGEVSWRLAEYEPEPGHYAVVIDQSDLRKFR